MSFGKGSNTTTSQTAPNAQAYAAYSGLLGQAAGVASTPYQAYTGQLTAPVNSQQTTGINAINQNAGFASPYIQQAASYATQAAQPVTASQIAGYESPYTQQVVNATQSEFNNQNAQQQSALTGNAVSAGALGGDRAGVAAANLAGQQSLAQAPVIAGLENTGYQNASQTALAEQSNLGNAAYSLGNLGVAGQNAALTGANAQVGAGTLQQQTQQAQDTAAYQQFEQQLAYPFQTTQWLAGIDTGVGSQMGGTSSTTAPPPNVLAQLLGLGVAGAGLFAPTKTSATGGRVAGFDGGGAVNFIGGMPYSGINGYVPSANITSGSGAPKAPGVAGGPAGPTLQQFGQAGKGLASLFGGNSGNAGTGADIDWDQNFGEGWKRGGGVHGFADGGDAKYYKYPNIDFAPAASNDFPPIAGFGDASPPAYVFPPDSFGDKFDAAYGANAAGGVNYDASLDGPNAYPLTGDDPLTKSENNFGFDFNPTRTDANLATAEGLPGEGDVDIPANATTTVGDAEGLLQGQDALRRKAGVAGSPDVTSYAPVPGTAGAPALAPSGVAGAPSGVAPTTKADAKKEAGFGFGFLSPEAKIGLMSAGLGMMASRSPFLGTAIGEGGLAGLSAYSGQVKQNASIEDARKKLEQSAKQHADALSMETQKLAQAKEFHDTLSAKDQAGIRHQDNLAAEAQRVHDIQVKRIEAQLEQGNYSATPGKGVNPETGESVEGSWLLNKKTGEHKFVPGFVQTGKGAPGEISPEQQKSEEIAGRRLANGDLTALTNVGRGTQGDAKLTRIYNNAAKVLTEEMGLTPQQAAAHLSSAVQEYKARGVGLGAEARTAGNREANLNLILRATEAAIPAALEASDKVGRTGWVPLNQIIQRGQVIASNPELKEFGMANLQLAEHWARAMNPTGVMRESDRDKALGFLSTADSPETYKRAVMQLQKQITRERDAVRGERAGAAPAAQPAASTPQEGERKQFKQGWGVFHGGQWVPAGASP